MIDTTKRNYTLTDADLGLFATNLTIPMTRDATEFAAKGVTAADITDLGTAASDFLALPTDSYYEADLMLAAEEKNAFREAMEIKMRDIVQLAEIKWGQRSPQLKRFGAGQMTKESDAEFVVTANKVVNAGTLYLADLTPLGLTQAMLDALEADAGTMLTKMNAIHSAELERDIKSEERIEKGNELYALVVKYCEIGKIIWDDVDEAKYNDYVIYSYPAGVPGKVLNMGFTPSTNTVSWDAELTADSYELQYAPNSPTPTWFQIYAGTATEFRHDGVTGICLYRCRGINENGYGYWSDVLVISR